MTLARHHLRFLPFDAPDLGSLRTHHADELVGEETDAANIAADTGADAAHPAVEHAGDDVEGHAGEHLAPFQPERDFLSVDRFVHADALRLDEPEHLAVAAADPAVALVLPVDAVERELVFAVQQFRLIARRVNQAQVTARGGDQDVEIGSTVADIADAGAVSEVGNHQPIGFAVHVPQLEDALAVADSDVAPVLAGAHARRTGTVDAHLERFLFLAPARHAAQRVALDIDEQRLQLLASLGRVANASEVAAHADVREAVVAFGALREEVLEAVAVEEASTHEHAVVAEFGETLARFGESDEVRRAAVEQLVNDFHGSDLSRVLWWKKKIAL